MVHPFFGYSFFFNLEVLESFFGRDIFGILKSISTSHSESWGERRKDIILSKRVGTNKSAVTCWLILVYTYIIYIY